MKTYEITFTGKDGNVAASRYQAQSIGEAQSFVRRDEGDVPLHGWHVVPTARQIRKTKSLLRNL